MSTDELVVAIEEFMAKYDPYGFYDTYGSWKPTEQSFEDIKKQVESKDKHMVAWFEDVANNSDDPEERDEADVIYIGLIGADVEASTKVTAGIDIFGEDPEFFFTRDDIIDYIETPLEDRIPEIKSCRGYIDKENDKYILSVDIITDDYDLTGESAPTATIDMRRIRKPSDLSRYVEDILAEYTQIVQAYEDVAELPFKDDSDYLFEEDSDRYYDPDPTQYGSLDDPRTPWGGSVI